MNTLKKNMEAVDAIDTSLENTMTQYKKTIDLCKDILKQLNQHEKTFQVLKKESDTLIHNG